MVVINHDLYNYFLINCRKFAYHFCSGGRASLAKTCGKANTIEIDSHGTFWLRVIGLSQKRKKMEFAGDATTVASSPSEPEFKSHPPHHHVEKCVGASGWRCQHFRFLKILWPSKSQTYSNSASTRAQASRSVLATFDVYSSWPWKSSSARWARAKRETIGDDWTAACYVEEQASPPASSSNPTHEIEHIQKVNVANSKASCSPLQENQPVF